jgi:dihydropteroate synthase
MMIDNQYDNDRMILRLKENELRLGERCHYMGIVNVTPDSFSDGGRCFSTAQAVDRALEMAADGADIVDIGGESTRPGAEPVSPDEELKRVLPVIEEFGRHSTAPISIDTRNASTAAAALQYGASIVNDVSALRHDERMAETIAAGGAAVVLMHMLGRPATMQDSPAYADVTRELISFFSERVAFARASGIRDVIIDPGIGFGKRLEDNLRILNRLHEFLAPGCPLLVGVSRKAFIGAVTGAQVGERLPGTIASCVVAALNGAHMLRVHDVKEVRAAVRVCEAIKRERGDA